MTIAELIEELRRRPPGMRVVVAAYELGWNDVETLAEIPIRPNPDHAWYFGKYEDCEEEEPTETALRIGNQLVRQEPVPDEETA